jgi:hypothetical protein
MSPAYESVFYGFTSLCLGLVTTCVVPLSLPSVLSAALGFSMSPEQLGKVELVLLAMTVVVSATFIFNGMLAAMDLRSRNAPER